MPAKRNGNNMHFISRSDNDFNGTHGYFFRLQLNGIHIVRRLFSDSKYGCKDNALKAAQDYRDTILRRYPIKNKDNLNHKKFTRKKALLLKEEIKKDRKVIMSWEDERGKYKTYREVSYKFIESEAQRIKFILYMSLRWPNTEEKECLTGYAIQWAGRFNDYLEYEFSNPAGQRILKLIDPKAERR